MKLAYAVACPDITSKSVIAYRGDFKAAIASLAGMGYEGVELVIRDPLTLDADGIARLCSRERLAVPVVCTGELYGEEGLNLTDSDESLRAKAVHRMQQVINFAAALEASVNIGRVRGSYREGVPKERTETWALEVFRSLARHAAHRGTRLLLEPVNRFQSTFINTTQEGIEIVQAVGHECFQLMVDLFHMNIEDRSITESIREAAPYLGHVHVCDSNRRAPGEGHLDFAAILTAFHETGYRGFLSGEVLPEPNDRTAAEMTITYLRNVREYLDRPRVKVE